MPYGVIYIAKQVAILGEKKDPQLRFSKIKKFNMLITYSDGNK